MNFQEHIINKSNKDLIEIYVNADNYQPEFVNQVYEELTKRGVSLDQYIAENEAKSHTLNLLLEQGRKGNEVYLILGFNSAFLGGVIGIIAGYTFSQSKQDGPSGERFYTYDKQTRDKGRIMMTIGVFVFLIIMTWKFS